MISTGRFCLKERPEENEELHCEPETCYSFIGHEVQSGLLIQFYRSKDRELSSDCIWLQTFDTFSFVIFVPLWFVWAS